jgi:hypothetical protein
MQLSHLKPIDFAALREAALAALFERYSGSATGRATTETILEMTHIGSIQSLHDELISMRNEGLVEVGAFPQSEKSAFTYGWRLTKDGALLVGDTNRRRQQPNDTGEDRWEPLPLDRSTNEYTLAVDATAHAIKEIEQSNGYSASAHQERNAILGTVKAAFESLKDGWITGNMVKYGLFLPLKYVAEKFSTAAIGEWAKIAVAALAELFKRIL